MKISQDIKRLLMIAAAQHDRGLGHEWLLLLEYLCMNREDFFAAFNSLAAEKQILFIKSLYQEVHHPFASTVLILMAENVAEINDLNLRNVLSELSLTARLKITEKVFALSGIIKKGNEICEQQANILQLAAERERVDVRAALLQAESLKQYEKEFSECLALEYKLAGYQVESALIRQNTVRLLEEIAALEPQLQVQAATVQQLQRQASDSKAVQAESVSEVETLQLELQDTVAMTDSLRHDIAVKYHKLETMQVEINELKKEQGTIDNEISKKEEIRQYYYHEVQVLQAKLEEIKVSAAMQQAEQIYNKVEEVFKMLPADEAE